MNFLFIFTVAAITILRSTAGERLHEQIYSSIEGSAACFRRLNGTHQAGCSSSDKGAVGVVHMIKSIDDAEWMALNASAGPYVAVISTTLFYDTIEVFMKHPNNVAGILIYVNTTPSTMDSFTQESRCPNEYSSGPGSQCSSSEAGGIVWNEKGTGLLRRNIPFPIFFLPQNRSEEVDKIENCHNRFNLDKENQKGRPLCSIQLTFFMYAAVNSEVCMRRSAVTTFLTPTKVCDPLSDQNVYYSLFPRGKDTDAANKSVTLVTARIDSASLFDGLSPGAASSVVGLVSLITAATTLAKIIPISDANLYNHNIVWTLFNGEVFDYIGSQRVAYDLARGAWPSSSPLSVSQVRLHLELGQLGGSFLQATEQAAWNLTAFVPYLSAPPAEIIEFLNEMSGYLTSGMTVTPQFTTNLPPSSLHSFRRILRNATESAELPELLITDHAHTFNNKFYQSALDDASNVAFTYHNISVDADGTFLDTDELIANGTMKDTEIQVKIARFVTSLSKALYQRVVGAPYTGNVNASAHLVDELLQCYLKSQACRLLEAADYASSGSGPGEVPDRAPPMYVSVASWPGPPAVFAGHLLALLAGTHVTVDKAACDAMKDGNFSYYWLRGWNHTGVCVQTTMNFTQALSPAFIIPDYDFSSGEYSTWTESVWQAMSARVFVSAGGGGARTAAITGAAATLVSAVITYWLQRHANVIFRTNVGSVPPDATAGILRTVNC